MQIGKVDQHARLENDRRLAGDEPCFAVDDSDGGVDYRIQSVDIHDHGVEIRHFRIDGREIGVVHRIDFGHELRQALRMLVELDQRPGNIRSML